MGFQTEHLEDEIELLKEANAKLAGKLKITTEALEFYADRDNWHEGDFTESATCIIGDSMQVGRDCPVGGKLATNTLGKIRG